MSSVYDKNNVPVDVGCEMKSTRSTDSIPLRCIGILEEWVFVVQKMKNSLPWAIPIKEFPNTQYIVTKQPDEAKND